MFSLQKLMVWTRCRQHQWGEP